MSMVQVRRENNFVLIDPVSQSHRHELVTVCPNSFNINEFLHGVDIVAIDFETRGNDISSQEFGPVGIGLATSKSIVYLDLTTMDDEDRRHLYRALLNHGNLIAHNVQFDAGCMAVEMRRLGIKGFTQDDFPFVACTYGLYMQCANEGWKGQRWGLKEAMVQVLGWETSNESGIDNWLMENNYVKGSGKTAHADKSQMWRVPASILGAYCAADADACYQLFCNVLQPCAESFTELVDFHQRVFLHNVRILIDAKLQGIGVDVDGLQRVNLELQERIESTQREFEDHPLVAPIIQKWRDKEAEKYVSGEPERLTRKGKISKSWEAWKNKIDTIKLGTHSKIRFNIGSQHQMRFLFYKNLYKTEIVAKADDKSNGRARIYADGGRAVDIELTKAGFIPVSKHLFGAFGELGKILASHHKAVKAQQYVQSYLSLQRNGRLYPSFIAPGTKTGRLGGKDPNIQQVPKIPAVLECFVADEGNVIIDADFSSLEQVVLAELSRDEALMKLYGPGSSPANDVYLYNACSMGPLKDKVRKYYDPDSPTEESRDLAKKECKKERTISKGVTLAKSYGAGSAKIYSTLKLAGVDITLESVEEMVRGLDDLYSGSKEYGRWLQSQWKANNGWVIDGTGQPVAVYHKYLKDITNRVVQRTGHSCLMIYLVYLERRLNETKLPWSWYIPDWHDETMIQCKKEHAKQLTTCFDQARMDLNEELGGIIPLQINPNICMNLASAKLEDYNAEHLVEFDDEDDDNEDDEGV